jgi:hypothetical protein
MGLPVVVVLSLPTLCCIPVNSLSLELSPLSFGVLGDVNANAKLGHRRIVVVHPVKDLISNVMMSHVGLGTALLHDGPATSQHHTQTTSRNLCVSSAGPFFRILNEPPTGWPQA